MAALFQEAPQCYRAELRITAAHILDQLQRCRCMLVWVTVRTPGPADRRLHTPIPAGPPEILQFTSYFIWDCLYAMSCVILLPMKDAALSRLCFV